MALAFIYLVSSLYIAARIARTVRLPLNTTPRDCDTNYEEISFPGRVDAVTLNGWFIPGNSRGTVIVVHGGKQNRADPAMKLLELCCDLADEGFSVLTFDRRGCGESELPQQTLRAFFSRDIGGACDYIRSRKGADEPVYILGISVGAAASLAFATKDHHVQAIVADSCFMSAGSILSRILKRIHPLLVVYVAGIIGAGRLLYRYSLTNPIHNTRRITCPILFIGSELDDSITTEETRQLYKAAPHPHSELWVVKDAEHAQAYSTIPEEYIRRVSRFLREAGQKTKD